jgi:flagellar biosynthesis protein FlhB
MAEQAGEKTQDATPHRRQQAREKGQVAFSQDLSSAALLIIATLLLMTWGEGIIQQTVHIMKRQLGTVGPLVVDEVQVIGLAKGLVSRLGSVLLPIIGLLALGGALMSIFQVGFLFVPDRLLPDISRLNPLAGIKRIISLTGVMRLGFGFFKVIVVTATASVMIYLRRDQILYCSGLEIGELARLLADICLSTTLWCGVALFLLAIFDYSYQRWKHEQDLRMTHQEVREEMKNLQGDPQIIARRRAVQRQMALNRIGTSVPKADVIVTNPTELAIAIAYEPREMAAPVVVAKGAGVIAQRIRRLALENDIPIVERKPLARLLYKEVETGQPIPDESFAAVAEVLAYVYQLKGKKIPNLPGAAA